ncbi:MAG: glycosyltransferase family 2 protein [Thermodesulfobacteriota bacterium]
MFTPEFKEYVATNLPQIKEKQEWGQYIHSINYYRIKSLVPPRSKVLAIGPWVSTFLHKLDCETAVGVDPFAPVIDVAYPPNIRIHSEYNGLADCREKFDYILLSFSIGFMEDILESLLEIRRFCHEHTRLIVTYYRKLWQPFIKLAELIGVKNKSSEMNWVPPKEIENFLQLADFQIIKDFMFCLMPLRIPFLANFINKYIANLPLIRSLGVLSMVVGRPMLNHNQGAGARPYPLVSIVIPARNEEGNIPEIIKRIPEFPGGQEIIFVEGGSTDNTRGAIQQVMAANPGKNILFLTQDGNGKKNAVLKGFSQARGEILLILDADMTVPPESLLRFVEPLVQGKAEFINGSRLVYPMRGKAMRFLNLLGNIFFGKCFAYILDQPVRDTLCGTKVLWRRDYLRMEESFRSFRGWDPFGDFDLLFGATNLNLKIVDLPVRYTERTYGNTNIDRWRHGYILLKMVIFGLIKLKFNWLRDAD